MKSLPRPLRDARSTFELCVDRVKDSKVKSRLMTLASAIECAESNYISSAVLSSLFSLVGTVYCRDELIKLYTNVLSRKNSQLRYIYDEIRAGPNGDICPLCSQRTVSTLDHYLEKATFPLYAVTPVNLIPSCSECNKTRSTAHAKSASEQTFHPYFDSVEDEQWLQANIVEADPVTVIYTTLRPSAWTKLKQDRVQAHFRALALGALYATHAAAEMTGIRYALLRIADREGAVGITAHLVEQATSRRAAFRNSWQGALYAALSTSNWFCNGGYSYIPVA
jgi:hypothetical protein